MERKVLVTGGAGFIGSHLVDGLLRAGHRVRVLDLLVKQVHGVDSARPSYLSKEVEIVVGDVRDGLAISRCLDGVDAVFHQAAAVGVGQSMYEIVRYTETNVLGTARLLEEISKRRDQIRRVVVASSMSNYGEGRYRNSRGELVQPPLRSAEQLASREWELIDEDSGELLEPVATDEGKPLDPTSVYATTKRDQEELVVNVCRAYGVPAVALRYFNVYGTRQALSNPYTGVAAIFSARMLNEKQPLIFEDGLQTRDFTHVSDVVQANLRALDCEATDGLIVNVGTGVPTDLLSLSQLLADALGRGDRHEPTVVGRFRAGDIRHCYADISAARRALGFSPRVALEDGVADLIDWVSAQSAADRIPRAWSELEDRALVR